jgi:hypothetical protein
MLSYHSDLFPNSLWLQCDLSPSWTSNTQQQSANAPQVLEPNMKLLDRYSTAIFFAAKKFMENGEYGSLVVERDATQVLNFHISIARKNGVSFLSLA